MDALGVLLAFDLALLAALVAGALRSHAAIVRALHRQGLGLGEAGPVPGPGSGAFPLALGRRAPRTPGPPTGASATHALDVAGTTPAGQPVEVPVRSEGRDTVVAFLSSTCATCVGLWRDLSQPGATDVLPSGTRLVVITRDPGEEDAGRVGELAPAGHPVVMSSEAWRAYGPPVTPYFVHVDGPSGEIVGQGSGHSWAQVASLLGRAAGDAAEPSARRRVRESEAEIDRRLLASGIRPGDPRLYHRPHED